MISLLLRTAFLGGILLFSLGGWSVAQAAQPVNLPGIPDTSMVPAKPIPLPTPVPDVSLFDSSPSNIEQTWSNGTPVELGVKFKSSAIGRVRAIRFYKAAANTSPHVGNLWSASGALLATVNFTYETASGWQQANFSNPVTLTPGTIYVASYHTTIYSRDDHYFTNPVSRGPLTAPDSSTGGGNGVFTHGVSSSFPSTTYNAQNYWVDVMFEQTFNLPPPPVVALDATAIFDQGTPNATVVTPSFSTSAGYELFLAFVATDYSSGANTTVTKVTGAGLGWSLVKRTNVQAGTAEIWRAFATSPLTQVNVTATLSQSVASSITVMTFKGIDTSGPDGSGAIGATGTANAPNGAPTARLTTTRNNSWVVGVGNDYQNAVNRIVGSNQTLVHQYLTPLGDTYWVQRQSMAIPSSGTSVIINDSAPTADQYNLSLCEILPFPYLPVP